VPDALVVIELGRLKNTISDAIPAQLITPAFRAIYRDEKGFPFGNPRWNGMR
jgi:hypothetical protein